MKGAAGRTRVSREPLLEPRRAAQETCSGPRWDHLGTWSHQGPDGVPVVALVGAARDLIEASRGTAHAVGLLRVSVGTAMGRALAFELSPDDLRVAAVAVTATRRNAFSWPGAEVEQRLFDCWMMTFADGHQALVPPAGPRTFRSEAQECIYGAKYNLVPAQSSACFTWAGPARNDSRDEGVVSS